ncbi:DedA family protein [Microlunatus elymi]|uniref:DedA family protein n=1 Tax=Microlunatus elymi TaxID=2596828 RepID=A0A516PZ01_9ACTN|nr:DedA family protein [Microlunatus elymi]QDP96406.1 DedA family protein [Microlunatus elymi]
MIENVLSAINDFVLWIMEQLGALGAGIAVALENLFPPIPSELILPLAGFTAGQGKLVLWQALIWTTIGSVVGALILYGIGTALGERRLRRLVDKLPLMSVEDLDKAEAWFDRHGSKAVLIGRLVPIVRSLISVPAGVRRMPILQFALLTAIGSGIWNTVLVGLGFLLGSQWHLVEDGVGVFQKVVVAAAVAAIVLLLVLAIRRWRAAAAGRQDALSRE